MILDTNFAGKQKHPHSNILVFGAQTQMFQHENIASSENLLNHLGIDKYFWFSTRIFLFWCLWLRIEKKRFHHFGKSPQKPLPKMNVIQTEDCVVNLQKNYVFPTFPFSKKVAFFSRAGSLEISRGRLARQAPAYGWGSHRGTQSTRDTVNAGRGQGGQQLTQMAVKGGGGHYCRQPSLKEADRNIIFHTPTMTYIRHEG